MSNELQEYRTELVTLTHKSQDAFEKQLSYISAGSLALSIGFIKEIVKNIKTAENKCLLTIAWVLLAMTLLINLFSHITAARFHWKTIKEIDQNKYNQEKAIRRIQKLNLLNIISIIALVLGIFLFIIFVSSNLE